MDGSGRVLRFRLWLKDTTMPPKTLFAQLDELHSQWTLLDQVGRDAVGEDVAADDIGISLSCPSVPESGVSAAY